MTTYRIKRDPAKKVDWNIFAVYGWEHPSIKIPDDEKTGILSVEIEPEHFVLKVDKLTPVMAQELLVLMERIMKESGAV